jgi:hypothetical protein
MEIGTEAALSATTRGLELDMVSWSATFRAGAAERLLSHAAATMITDVIVRRTETRALADIDPSMRRSEPTGPSSIVGSLDRVANLGPGGRRRPRRELHN